MNFKTTIVLLVLLIVVGAVLFYTENHSKPAEEQTQLAQPGEGGQRILDLGAGSVQSLTITDASGQRTSIEKAGTGWKLTEPVAAPAVEWQTTDLVRSLTDLRSQGRPEGGANSDTGLDQPRYRVDLNLDNGKTIHLLIGNNTGVGDVMYAQVDGGEINLVESGLAKTLKAAGTDLRDKKVFTIASAAVKQFRITSGNQTLSGTLDNGNWKITEPVEEPGDAPAITSLLSTVTTSEASEFVKSDSDELAFARFDHPLTSVWLSTDAPATQPATQHATPAATGAGSETMTVGAPDSLAKDHYFVQMSNGLVAKVPSSVLDSFKKTALDLRDKDVVAILPAEVKAISIVKETFPPGPTTQSTQPSIATTLPSSNTMPSSTTRVELALRPNMAAAIGPALALRPSTQPSTTQASSTLPATKPAEPPSKWMFAGPSGAGAVVDDTKVSAMLEKFNPLHADRFLEQRPASAKSQRYVVTLTTGAASGAPNQYRIEIVRPVNGDVPYAVYDGLTFEIAFPTVDALDADFHKTPAAP
jgi:hypothetical protein